MATKTRKGSTRSAGLRGKISSLLNMKYSFHALFAISFALLGVLSVLISYAAVPTGPIKNVGNGKCLENFLDRQVDGNFLSTYTCTGDSSEVWNLYSTDKSIRTKANFCVDVQKGGKTPMTKVHLWHCWGGAPQKWDILSTGQLRNPNSMLCLEAGATDTFLGGPNMYVNTCNATNKRQVWTVPQSSIPLPVPTPPPSNTPTTSPTAPSGMPTKQWIKDNAGPLNESTLQNSGSITVTQHGRRIENVRISNGVIYVKANDVTIRNCMVTGSSTRNVILLEQGYRNLTVEYCRVTVNSGGANGAVGSNGGTTGMIVRHNEILGYADGIKADTGGLYEYNYIHTSKPPGSIKHLDGIQGSGRSNWTARYNVVEEGAESGGNISIFSQAYNGTSCVHVSGVKIVNNYIYGGNHGIMVVGGKEAKCANPDSYQTGAQVIGNRFAPDPDNLRSKDSHIGFRYTFCSISAVSTTLSGNRFENGGLVPGCGS